jgi:hypothetical protein
MWCTVHTGSRFDGLSEKVDIGCSSRARKQVAGGTGLLEKQADTYVHVLGHAVHRDAQPVEQFQLV